MTDKEPLALPPGVDSVADLGTTVSLAEAAKRLGVSAKTVQRMVKRGDLVGAHKVPMPGGKGEQWAIPVATLYQAQTKQAAQTPVDETAQEITALRETVAKLEAELREQSALADERRHQLEQLHLTFRLALNAGETPKRKWFRKQPPTK